MDDIPLVSIIIPLYNAERYVSDTIKSIQRQTYSNWELLIVNDGSSDDGLSVVSNVRDERVRIFSQDNKGASAARNHGYKKSVGSLIQFLDADDLLSENYLAEQVKRLRGTDDSVAVAQWGRFYNDDFSFSEIVPNPSEHFSLQKWVGVYWYSANAMTNPGRILIPRVVVEKAGLWNEFLSLNDDMEFYTRIFAHSARLLFNDNATLHYRSGIDGLSRRKGEAAYLSLFNSFKLSVDLVLQTLHDKHTKKSCANLWQSFLYEIYPQCPRLGFQAEEYIRFLGGADLKFPSGGITGILSTILGWKTTKKLKLLIGRE